jgi:hypothetical protein
MRGYIYLIRNLLNGKAYIGKTEKSVSLRLRLSDSHKGHFPADETKARMSAAQKARWALRKEA